MATILDVNPEVPALAVSSRRPVRNPSAARGSYGTFIMFVVAAMGVLLYAFVSDADPVAGLWVSGLTCATVVIMALSAAYRMTDDILNPMSLGMIYFGLLFPFHGLVMVDDALVVGFHGIERWRWFGDGLLVATVGALMLHLGFRSSLARRLDRTLPSMPFRITEQSLQRGYILWVLMGVSVVAKLGLVASGLAFHFQHRSENVDDFMGIQFILVTASGLSSLAMLLFLGRGIRERRPTLLAAGIALVLFEIAWGLYSGSRLMALIPAVHVAILLNRIWRPLRVRHLVAAFGIFVFLVFPFLTAFRTSYNARMDEIARDGAQSGMVADTVGELFSDDDDRFASEQDSAIETLASRTHGLTSLSLIMRHTPERGDYLYGMPYLLLPLQIFVPRAIWPDKPNVAAFSASFRANYWGARAGDTTSIAVSQLGDLWVNLHMFGIILGCFMMGVLYRFFNDFLTLGATRDGLFRHVVFSLMLLPAVFGLSAMADAFIAGNIKTLLVFAIVGWLFRERGARVAA